MFPDNRLIWSLIVFLLLCTGINAQQNPSDAIEAYKVQLKKQDEERKSKVQQFAKDHAIPLCGYDEQGSFVFLHHIDEMNRPVYYSGKEEEKKQLIIKIAENSGQPMTGESAEADSVNVIKVYVETVNKNNNVEVRLNLTSPVRIESERILKKSMLHIESISEIHSVSIIKINGKKKFLKDNLSVKTLSVDLSKWKSGNYIMMIKLQNEKTYLNQFTI